MKCNGITGLVVGGLAGAVVGMLILPNLDRKTQRGLKKTSRMLRCVAEDAYDNIADKVR